MSQAASKIPFYTCSRASLEQPIRNNRPCDRWLESWADVDPQRTPLAIHYDHQIQTQIESEITHAIERCEQQRLVSEPPSTGLSIRVAAKLDASLGSGSNSGSQSTSLVKLAVDFSPMDLDSSCSMLPRELFAEAVNFNVLLYAGGNGNMSWTLQNPQPLQSDPYFALYDRTLRFLAPAGNQYLGQLQLTIQKVVDLTVQFTEHPIPEAVISRVDPNQQLNYQVSSGPGYFNIAGVIEVTHLDSGQVAYHSLHGDPSAGYMPSYSFWPNEWNGMAANAQGVIEHGGFTYERSIFAEDPEPLGLPTSGDFRLRAILLAYAFHTGDRWVTSSAVAQNGDGRMSWQPLFFSHQPSLTSYTPGFSEGLMPAFELDYSLGASLASGIEFDAVFDLKSITTFRFVVKLVSDLDFPVGLIVQASGWQAWVLLQPGQTRYLAGTTSVSGMSNTNGYPLHPNSPTYGWNRAWGNNAVQMDGFGNCKTTFNLYLTAPSQPESLPANLAEKSAVLRWASNPAQMPVASGSLPRWGAIKTYSPQGQIDYPSAFPGSISLKELRPSITKPYYPGLLNAVGYFVTGYNTPTTPWSSPWHKSPWPIAIGLSGLISVPLMVNGEERIWSGNQFIWTAFIAKSIYLSRSLHQWVAQALGISDYVIMDGDDLRWFELGPGGVWHNLLWIDRFYSPLGLVIDQAAMRTAFQTLINAHADQWPSYRNLTIHPDVRFGCFLDNGAYEVGEYLLGSDGSMVDVNDLSDLQWLSCRFRYQIKADFR